MSNNIGEGIFLSVLIVIVSHYHNYWFLVLAFIPLWSWTGINSDIRDKFNEYTFQLEELVAESLIIFIFFCTFSLLFILKDSSVYK